MESLGVLTLAAEGIAMKETIEKRYTESIISSTNNIGVFSRNRGFISLLITFLIIFNRIIIMGLMCLITSVISLILWHILSKKHAYNIV